VAVASIRNLTVNYGSFTALRDFSVDVPEGCTGLLGPNGAGKTTLLKTLLGFVEPATGGGTVLGSDIVREPRQVRQKVGLMPEQDCHIPGMSAVQFVAYAGELAGMPADQALRRAHESLEYCGLGEARYRNVETYSTGMKQRIKLAQAIIHGPKLLLLDEPTNGLDPAGREDMLDLVRDVSHGKGVNVIVSSHLLPDIERVCDEVMVVVGGHLRAMTPVKDLKRIEGHPVDIELREPNTHFIDKLQAQGIQLLEARPYAYRVQAPGAVEALASIALKAAKETGAQIRGIKVAERTLEEAFLSALEGK
jgi:ABC-2 type transport system ATP-binding protein